MFDAAAQIYTHMNACTHMQTSEKRRQKRVKKRYSVIATGNNYTLSLEVTRGDKNGRVGQEEGSVVVNPAINTREDACIALCKYLFSPTLVPQSCFYFIHVTKSLLFILACPSGSERLCFKNLMTLLYDFISEKYKAFVFFLHESALVYVVKHAIFIPFPCSAHTVCSVQHNSKNISQYLNSSLPDSYLIITLGL